MELIELLAPSEGPLLGVRPGEPMGPARAQLAVDWLPFVVGGSRLGERAQLRSTPPFDVSAILFERDGRVQAVEVVLDVDRLQAGALDQLEKTIKQRLRKRFGPYSKEQVAEPRPHWLERSSPAALWMTLRWVSREQAHLKVVMQLT